MKKIVALTLIMVTIFLGACSRLDTTLPPDNNGDTNTVSNESQAVAESLVSELDTSADTTTITGVSLSSLNPELSALGRFDCAIATGDVSDPDADGVPTAAVYTYDCTNIQYFGLTATITGVANISDPSIEPNERGFDSKVTDLRLELTGAYQNRDFTEKRNGTRNARVTPTGLSFQHDMTIMRDYQGAYGFDKSVMIGNKLTWVFTPLDGSSIVFDKPLPSGTVNASGMFSFNYDTTNKTFNVTTTTPLQYDANCDKLPRYTAGMLQAEHSSSLTGDNFITITYTGCGVKPTITVTPAE